MLVPTFFDFNLTSLFRRVWLRHMADQTLYERRPHRFRPTAGLPAPIRIRQVCSTLSRQLPRPKVDQLRTVRCHGFCPIDLAREFARHRNMSARSGIQTLSQRHSPTHRSQYAGRRQRNPRLAHLRRFRSDPHSTGRRALRQRTFCRGTSTSRLRAGLHYHRLVSVAFSVGHLPPTQGGHQTPHFADLAGQLSHGGYYHAWQRPRREHPGPIGLRSRFVLHHGPGLSGLCPLASHPTVFGFLRHACQKELPFSAALFPSGGQEHRSAFRPDGGVEWLLRPTGLSRHAAPHRLSRSSNRQGVALSDQQLYRARAGHRATLSWPLANRTVLQMGQAASAHQSLLRNEPERGAHPNLDCDLGLSAGGHSQKTSASGLEPLHHITDFEPDVVRENADFTGTFSTAAIHRIVRLTNSALFAGVLNRTVVPENNDFAIAEEVTVLATDAKAH